MNLRPYQTAMVEAVRQSIRSGARSPLLQAPTGSGKTIIAKAIVESANSRGNRVLFLAPRRELIYQICEKLDSADISYGVVMAGEGRNEFAPVQVACIPTLYRRAIKSQRMLLPRADVVIVDEAHLSLSKSCEAVLAAYPDAIKLGLTATPARGDGKGLGLLYDDLVLGPSVAELTAKGYLVPARYFAPSKPDLAGIKISMGDYNQKQLGNRMDQPQLVGDVVTNWLRICPDRLTVVFAVNRAHSRHLRDSFRDAGINAEHLDGETDNDERAAILGRVHSGETQVLCNCDVLTYGWDCPPISCAVLAKPTKSIVRYLQMVGRVLRPFDGKDDCIVIDHAGAVEEIGFADDQFDWTLSSKGKVEKSDKPGEKKKKSITCGECSTVFEASKACPHCGHETPASTYREAVEAIDADLVELDSKKKALNRKWSSEEKANFYGELLGYCRERGFRSGWANNAYKDRLGVWPNHYRDEPARDPSPETRAWCKHKLIRFAKSKKRQQEAA